MFSAWRNYRNREIAKKRLRQHYDAAQAYHERYDHATPRWIICDQWPCTPVEWEARKKLLRELGRLP